jgi:hypothetical protein
VTNANGGGGDVKAFGQANGLAFAFLNVTNAVSIRYSFDVAFYDGDLPRFRPLRKSRFLSVGWKLLFDAARLREKRVRFGFI